MVYSVCTFVESPEFSTRHHVVCRVRELYFPLSDSDISCFLVARLLWLRLQYHVAQNSGSEGVCLVPDLQVEDSHNSFIRGAAGLWPGARVGVDAPTPGFCGGSRFWGCGTGQTQTDSAPGLSGTRLQPLLPVTLAWSGLVCHKMVIAGYLMISKGRRELHAGFSPAGRFCHPNTIYPAKLSVLTESVGCLQI